MDRSLSSSITPGAMVLPINYVRSKISKTDFMVLHSLIMNCLTEDESRNPSDSGHKLTSNA